jgi:hypothetical protein
MSAKPKIAIIFGVLTILLIASGQTLKQNDTSPDSSIVDLSTNYTPPTVEPNEDNSWANKQANSMQDNTKIELTAGQRLSFAKEMSLYILAFGLILAIFTGVIAIMTKGWTREATNIFTVTIIITAGLFLMTAGYSSEQIAPMYGLLGTIVGYLLGKTRPIEQEAKPGQ